MNGTCKICGCTDGSPCIGPGGQTCHWVAPDLCSTCAAGELPVHQENWSSAALDGARIAAGTAGILIAGDPTIPPGTKDEILEALEQAQNWLDAARQAFVVKTTSLRVVEARSPIIEVAKR